MSKQGPLYPHKTAFERAAEHFNVPIGDVTRKMVENLPPRGTGLAAQLADLGEVAKGEALTALEQSATFSSLKSTRSDVARLKGDAYMLHATLARTMEIIYPYVQHDEYASIGDLEQASLHTLTVCTRALIALDSIIKRGLI